MPNNFFSDAEHTIRRASSNAHQPSFCRNVCAAVRSVPHASGPVPHHARCSFLQHPNSELIQARQHRQAESHVTDLFVELTHPWWWTPRARSPAKPFAETGLHTLFETSQFRDLCAAIQQHPPPHGADERACKNSVNSRASLSGSGRRFLPLSASAPWRCVEMCLYTEEDLKNATHRGQSCSRQQTHYAFTSALILSGAVVSWVVVPASTFASFDFSIHARNPVECENGDSFETGGLAGNCVQW